MDKSSLDGFLLCLKGGGDPCVLLSQIRERYGDPTSRNYALNSTYPCTYWLVL